MYTHKPWTTVGVNLKAYIGQTLSVVITNVDCALGGHFCHSYWDFQCGSIPLNGGCSGTQSTICAAASDPLNPYTYQWYKNGNLLQDSIAQCIVVTPYNGDTFLVKIHQVSGCDFYMNYRVSSGILQSLFSYSANANVITFSDLSAGAISYYSWNFGDGNISTQQNPFNTYSATGTYTACLTVSDSTCHDTFCKVITISVVDIKENELISLVSAFPNPASKIIFLDFGGKDFGKAEVSLSNVVGKTLVETTVSANGKKSLDVSGFSRGIYFLKLKTHFGIVTKKIVIAP